MNIKECYEAFGGDFEDVLHRLQKPERVEKFLRKFPNDPNYENLCKSLEAQNAEEAFRAAHTLKGLSQNLSLTPLCQPSADMTEALRGGQIGDSAELLPKVTEAYDKIMNAVNQLD